MSRTNQEYPTTDNALELAEHLKTMARAYAKSKGMSLNYATFGYLDLAKELVAHMREKETRGNGL